MTGTRLPPRPWWPAAAVIAWSLALGAAVRGDGPVWVVVLLAVLALPQYVLFVAWLYAWRRDKL